MLYIRKITQLSQYGLYVWKVCIEPLFLGRLGRLTSHQMVSQYCLSFAWRHKHSIYFFRPQWAGPIFPPDHPFILFFLYLFEFARPPFYQVDPCRACNARAHRVRNFLLPLFYHNTKRLSSGFSRWFTPGQLPDELSWECSGFSR